MSKTAKKPNPRQVRRGTLARPLDALVFLLPLILFYEITSLARNDRVISFEFLRQFLQLFGRVGFWAPGLAVIVILLATHAASGDKWVIHWRRVGFMYVESLALSIPLLLLSWSVPLAAGNGADALHSIALGIGAGVYEELVFRLIMISVIVILAADIMRLDRAGVAVAAVLLSSLAFAAHHHPPIGTDPFRVVPFLFRTMAGVYLAVIFWFRGYGPAAGCHAAYNLDLVLLDAISSFLRDPP